MGTTKRAHPEDTLQADIIAWHAKAIRTCDAILFAVPNGERRDAVTAARLSGISEERRNGLPDHEALLPFGQGLLPGVTDLVLLLPHGRTLWIEVKTPEITWPPANLPCAGVREVLHKAGRLSKVQRRFQAGLLALEHAHHVIRYLSDYHDLAKLFGVPLHAPRPWGPGVTPPAP